MSNNEFMQRLVDDGWEAEWKVISNKKKYFSKRINPFDCLEVCFLQQEDEWVCKGVIASGITSITSGSLAFYNVNTYEKVAAFWELVKESEKITDNDFATTG